MRGFLFDGRWAASGVRLAMQPFRAAIWDNRLGQSQVAPFSVLDPMPWIGRECLTDLSQLISMAARLVEQRSLEATFRR